MKRNFTRSLAALFSLLVTLSVYAQSPIEITQTTVNQLGNNNTLYLEAGKSYVIKSDVTLTNKNLRAGQGSALIIEASGKLTVHQIQNPAANDGVFKVAVAGKLLFSQTNILTNGVDITVENGGLVQGGVSSMQDLQFNNNSTNNKITVKTGGEFKVSTVTFGNNNSRYEIDNYGLIKTTGNINMNGTVIFRNQNRMEVGDNYNQNNKSIIINCAYIETQKSYNLNGGQVINTGEFIVKEQRIDMGDGGVFRNYATVDAAELNLNNNGGSYVYNEGTIKLRNYQNNNNSYEALGGNGVIKGPVSPSKRGYIVFPPTAQTLNSIAIQGNINVTLFGNSTDLDINTVFKNVPSQHNVAASVTYKPCSGRDGSCFNLPVPTKYYGACPDFNGNFASPIVTVSHDPAGTGPNSNITATNNLTLYALLVGTDGKVKESIQLVNSKATLPASGTKTSPEQTDYAGYKVMISTTNATIGSNAPAPSLPTDWVFTKDNINQGTNNYSNGKKDITGPVSSVNFGIQQRPKADNKVWEISSYTANETYVLGKATPTNVTLSGNDPEDGNLSNNATYIFENISVDGPPYELFYNGSKVNNGDKIANLDFEKLTIKFSTPALIPFTTVFHYKTVDAADAKSDVATYTINYDPANNNPLPLEYINIHVKDAGSSHIIEWSVLHTEPEHIVEYAVERSTDGARFSTLGTVAPIANATDKHIYSFTDHAPAADNNYYRIRLKEISGEVFYSNIVTKRATAFAQLRVYPNPAQQYVNIEFSTRGKYTVQLFDINGKLLSNHLTEASTGTVLTIQRNQLQSGTYILRITNQNGQVTSQKVVFN